MSYRVPTVILFALALGACGERITPLVDGGPPTPEAGADANTGADANADTDANADGGGCTGETDARLCSDADRQCGAFEATDSCGTTRTVVCGSCEGASTCGGGGVPGSCGCTEEETDVELCLAAGASCGTQAFTDACGRRRDVVCGTCDAPATCGGSGAAGICGCTPQTDVQLCSDASANCGTLSLVDRCGASREVTCGTCASPLVCGDGGTANRCGCALESDGELCVGSGTECGPVVVNDRCGTRREVECGGCGAFETCGGGGEPSVCGCIAETDAALCASVSARCGTLTLTDTCGVSRTPTCGTCAAPGVCGAARTCVDTSKPFDPICDAQGWCWENPLPQGNTLLDVAAVSASDIWVVGAGGTVLRWNGSRWGGWTGVGDGSLFSVWARTADDVWLVGDRGTVIHWDGSALRPIDAGTTRQLYSVWGSGPNDVWIGGYQELKRWDGTTWTEVPFPRDSVIDLHGFARDDVWGIGSSGTVYHYDGTGWTESLDTPGSFAAIWGASSSAMWAVGDDGSYRYDGVSWTRVHYAVGNSVWGTSATDVWVAADRAMTRRIGASIGSWAYHFDGLDWSQERISARYPTTFHGVGGVAGVVLLVGDGGAMYRRTGDTWTSIQEGVINRSMELTDLSGTDRDEWTETFPLSMNAWLPPTGAPVVGSPRSTSYSDTVHFGGLLMPTGSGWDHLAISTNSVVGTGWGTATPMTWVAESSGDVVLGVGGVFSTVLEPSGGFYLPGIWAAGDGDLWLVGGDDTYRYSGGSWTQVPNPVGGTAARLNAVWGNSSGSAVWAVGENGLVLHWNGTSWVAQASGTSGDLVALSGRSASDIWAVGPWEEVIHFDGVSWTTVTAPSAGTSVYVHDDGTVFVVAGHDLYRRSIDGTWTELTVPVTRRLYAIAGRGDELWAVGDDMAILSRGRR